MFLKKSNVTDIYRYKNPFFEGSLALSLREI